MCKPKCHTSEMQSTVDFLLKSTWMRRLCSLFLRFVLLLLLGGEFMIKESETHPTSPQVKGSFFATYSHTESKYAAYKVFSVLKLYKIWIWKSFFYIKLLNIFIKIILPKLRVHVSLHICLTQPQVTKMWRCLTKAENPQLRLGRLLWRCPMQTETCQERITTAPGYKYSRYSRTRNQLNSNRSQRWTKANTMTKTKTKTMTEI